MATENNMINIEEKLKSLGYTLPEAPAKGGVYTPCREFGNGFAYVSGCGPSISGDTIVGKIGDEVSFEDGQKAAINCMLNVLAVIKQQLGDLSRVKRFVKALVFVSSNNNFYDQPKVANAASNLLAEIFGDEIGTPARSAIGVNVLPGNISVEIEMLLEFL